MIYKFYSEALKNRAVDEEQKGVNRPWNNIVCHTLIDAKKEGLRVGSWEGNPALSHQLSSILADVPQYTVHRIHICSFSKPGSGSVRQDWAYMPSGLIKITPSCRPTHLPERRLV
jgi:hypothetical protein